METISCHSNQRSCLHGIKIITFVQGNVQFSVSSSLQFLRRRILNIFFVNLPFMSPPQPINLRYLDKVVCNMEDYSINISVKKKSNISSETSETVNFQFSHYKSMGTIGCHSNQMSYPTVIKKTQLLERLIS